MKNSISIEVIKNENLSKSQKEMINSARVREWGEDERKDFSKDYETDMRWYFVKDKGKVVSLGGLRPVKINYLGKRYNILGICTIISLVKGKGYGKILISFMKNHAYKTGKTILGFTNKTEFYKKAGLKNKKDLIRRFVYVKPNGEKVYDNEGDGIYYEGKDNFVSNILKTKRLVEIKVLHW